MVGGLPDHLTEREFREIASEAGSLFEIQQEARVSREQARTLVHELDVDDAPSNYESWENRKVPTGRWRY